MSDLVMYFTVLAIQMPTENAPRQSFPFASAVTNIGSAVRVRVVPFLEAVCDVGSRCCCNCLCLCKPTGVPCAIS